MKLRIIPAIAAVALVAFAQAPTTTTVYRAIYAPDATPVSGPVYVTLYVACNQGVIGVEPIRRTLNLAPILVAGVPVTMMTIDLVPNDTCLPSSWYTFQWNLTGQASSVETIVVPTSSTPLPYASLIQSTALPTPLPQINPSQINGAGATTGEALCFNGLQYGPGSCTGGSGAVTSIFGRTGAVTAQTGDYTTSQVTEGTNLYFTALRAVAAVGTGTISQYLRGDASLATFPALGSFAALNNPMTSLGDFLYGGTGGVPARLAVPADGIWCNSFTSHIPSWTTCPGAGGSGLTSVGLTLVSSGLSSIMNVTSSPLLANGNIGLNLTAGQTSHQVFGTCGSATVFGPCSLTATDIPALAYAPATPGTNGQLLPSNGSGGFGTPLSMPLDVGHGGTGTSSTLSGIVRGGTSLSASELSGDGSTSGSNSLTVTKTNGVPFGALATAGTQTGTNSINTQVSTISNTLCGNLIALTYSGYVQQVTLPSASANPTCSFLLSFSGYGYGVYPQTAALIIGVSDGIYSLYRQQEMFVYSDGTYWHSFLTSFGAGIDANQADFSIAKTTVGNTFTGSNTFQSALNVGTTIVPNNLGGTINIFTPLSGGATSTATGGATTLIGFPPCGTTPPTTGTANSNCTDANGSQWRCANGSSACTTAVQWTLIGGSPDLSVPTTNFGVLSSSVGLHTQGAINASSTSLVVGAGFAGFSAGNGVMVAGAGPTATVGAPTITSITPSCYSGTADPAVCTGSGPTCFPNYSGAGTCTPRGSTTYQYTVIAIDAYGGHSASSTAVSTTVGYATLSNTQYNTILFNSLDGKAVSYAICRVGTGVVGLVENSTYNNTNPGETFDDVGALQIPDLLYGIPTSCVVSASADYLNTQITAILGTTATLATAASTSVTNAYIYADDAYLINAAIGSVTSSNTGGSVLLPAAVLNINTPVVVSNTTGLFINGTSVGQTFLEAGIGVNWAPMVRFINSNTSLIRDLTLNWGGSTRLPISAINQNVNAPTTVTPSAQSVYNVTINGTYNGVTWTAAPGYDQNNEQTKLYNVNVFNYGNYCLWLGHTNSEEHKAYGINCSGGPHGLYQNGGQINVYGATSSFTYKEGRTFAVEMGPGIYADVSHIAGWHDESGTAGIYRDLQGGNLKAIFDDYRSLGGTPGNDVSIDIYNTETVFSNSVLSAIPGRAYGNSKILFNNDFLALGTPGFKVISPAVVKGFGNDYNSFWLDTSLGSNTSDQLSDGIVSQDPYGNIYLGQYLQAPYVGGVSPTASTQIQMGTPNVYIPAGGDLNANGTIHEGGNLVVSLVGLGTTPSTGSGSLNNLGSIASTACATLTVAVSRALSTDMPVSTTTGSITSVTGFIPSTSGGLTINPPYMTSGNINWDVCNWSTGSLTPGTGITLTWRVER